MALLRLTVLALGAAACGNAGAQPTGIGAAASGLPVPAGWQAMPELASSVGAAAKAEGVTIDGAEAWGEPARGCYAVWLALHGAGASADQILAGLAAEKLVTRDLVRPTGGDDGLVSVTFTRGAYLGRLRARIAAGTLTSLACFANEREPTACEAACTSLLGGLP